MKPFEWNADKNRKLKDQRGISFEEIVIAIYDGNQISNEINTNKKYPNQRIFVVKIDDYVYLVPFVEDEEKVFLKTIIPSRKATREYLKAR